MAISIQGRRTPLISVLMTLALSTCVWSQEAISFNKPEAPDSSTAIDKTRKAGEPPLVSDKAHDDKFVIGPADVLAINVWKETEISRSVPVRSDGRISLPLIGDVQASGRTPRQLQDDISKKLASFISEPDVTVIVQETHSQKINVLGQVGHPGTFLLTDSTTVLDAIALAGGFKDFAKQKQIYVLRQNSDGTQAR